MVLIAQLVEGYFCLLNGRLSCTFAALNGPVVGAFAAHKGHVCDAFAVHLHRKNEAYFGRICGLKLSCLRRKRVNFV